MATSLAKKAQYPPQKSQKGLLISQVAVRIMGIAVALTAIGLMLTSKQNIQVIGLQLDAKYTYSPAFTFFVAVYACACVLSALSLVLLLYFERLLNKTDQKKYFIIFLTGLIVMMLAFTGSSSASAIGFLGRYGNNHTGWMPICDHFGKFCNKIMASLITSYVSALFFVVITVWSALNSTKVQSSI